MTMGSLTEARRPTPGRLVPAAGLVALQARLFTPHVQGSGRWVLFDPATRRSFAAVGKDVVPDVIRVLEGAAVGASTPALAELLGNDGPDQLAALCRARLLVGDGDGGTAAGAAPTFLARYHEANFDYPFLDYSGPDWREKDRAVMGAYNQMQPPPPNLVERAGPLIALPPVGEADLFSGGPLDERGLATILRYTFGPLEVMPGAFKDHLRKTSPSGGARHPTEGVVVLPAAIGPIPAGDYWYDVPRHGLVAVAGYEGMMGGFPDGAVAVVLRSRVERPMWRYRDLRALRPTIIDAGHIAETLAVFFGRRGYDCGLGPVPGTATADWVTEPELACLVAVPGGTGEVLEPPPAARTAETVLPAGRPWPGRVLTNPFTYVSFESGGLMANVAWPGPAQVPLSIGGFQALSHCQPSSRRDRDTTVAGIRAAAVGVDPAEVRELHAAGALLVEGEALELHRQVGLWSRHDWYLSLLAHAEARATAASRPVRIVPESATAAGDSVVAAMLTRTTTRRFAAAPINADDLDEVVAAIGIEGQDRTRLLVTTLAVTGRPAATWAVGPDGPLRCVRPDGPSRETIQTICVGQQPAAAGAAIIWLLTDVDLADAARFEPALVHLGRLGHRICLRATELGLGVFQSPAVVDHEMTLAFPDAVSGTDVVYAFTVGVKESR